MINIDDIKFFLGFIRNPSRRKRWAACRRHGMTVGQAMSLIRHNIYSEKIQNDDIMNGTNNMDKEKIDWT